MQLGTSRLSKCNPPLTPLPPLINLLALLTLSLNPPLARLVYKADCKFGSTTCIDGMNVAEEMKQSMYHTHQSSSDVHYCEHNRTFSLGSYCDCALTQKCQNRSKRARKPPVEPRRSRRLGNLSALHDPEDLQRYSHQTPYH